MKTVRKKINLKNLFKLVNCDNSEYFKTQTSNIDIKIKTPYGFMKINNFVKKNAINCVESVIENNIIRGADKHLVKINNEWKTLDSFNHKKISNEDLYDVAINNPHEFLTTNGIIHHNTTIAKALVNDIKVDSIYINMSLESGIDTLRNRIAKFATSYSMFGENTGGKKICILDEFDGSTPALQAAMRGFMEEFQDSCRFILTCNYATKIIEPLKSRCQQVDFNMMDKKSQEALKPIIVKRLIGILKNEKVEFKPETIEKIVDTFYPDIRRMINLLQQYSKKSGIIDSGIFELEKVDAEFYEMILNRKLTNARKYVIERNYNPDEMYRQLFDNFVPMIPKNKQAPVILIISEMMYQSAFAIDKEITFTSCLLQIMGVLGDENI
jgi:DNA polymerase III delta prime subunit